MIEAPSYGSASIHTLGAAGSPGYSIKSGGGGGGGRDSMGRKDSGGGHLLGGGSLPARRGAADATGDGAKRMLFHLSNAELKPR